MQVTNYPTLTYSQNLVSNQLYQYPLYSTPTYANNTTNTQQIANLFALLQWIAPILQRITNSISNPIQIPQQIPTPIITNQKSIDVYLLGGQSNAVGLGAKRLESALETSLGKDTTNHKINVFSYAVGGTNLYTQWAGDGTSDTKNDGAVYKTFQTNLNQYMTQLKKDNPNTQINIKGMFWHQGESDALSSAAQQKAYNQNLSRFIQDVRATTHVNNLPFVIARLSDEQTSMSDAGRTAIQKAQDNVALATPNTISVAMESAQTSGIHFTEKGYDTMAKLLANGFKGYFQNIL